MIFGKILQNSSMRYLNQLSDLADDLIYFNDEEPRAVVVLFVRPNFFVNNAIDRETISLFHFWSGNHLNFYWAGYSPVPPMNEEGVTNFNIKGSNWYFYAEQFSNLVNDIENKCKWRYRGGARMLVFNSKRVNNIIEFDFRDLLDFSFENRNIPSVIESIISCIRETNTNNPTRAISLCLLKKSTKDLTDMFPSPFNWIIRYLKEMFETIPRNRSKKK